MADVLTDAQLDALVLEDGKVGYDRRGNVLKIGDGATAWPDLKEIRAVGGVSVPPNNGKTYALCNGHWRSIVAEAKYTSYITEPAVSEVNKEGELSVAFEFPFKYAMRTSEDIIESILHRQWRFPFAEGRIKRISFRANVPQNTRLYVSCNGTHVMDTYVYITTEWTHIETNAIIRKDNIVRLKLPTANILAADLQVEILFKVGNAGYTFISTENKDLVPNLYTQGFYANDFAVNGGLSPDNAFKSIYCPSVNRMADFNTQSIILLDDDSHAAYIIGGDRGKIDLLDSKIGSAPFTPVPIELPEGKYIVDAHGHPSFQGVLLNDGTYKNLSNVSYVDTNASGITMINHSASFNSSNEIRLLYNGNENMLFRAPYNNKNVVSISFNTGNRIKKMEGNYVLMTNGTLFEAASFGATALTEVAVPAPVKDMWFISASAGTTQCSPTSSGENALYILTEDNELYFIGGYYPVGLTSLSNTSSWQLIGEHEVKKVVGVPGGAYFLMSDGSLWFRGKGENSTLPYYNLYAYELAQVYRNYYFHDLVVLKYSGISIIAFAEYLGELENA